MFPGQWREVLEQLVWHDRPAGSERFHGSFEVARVPEHDRGDDEVQPAGAGAAGRRRCDPGPCRGLARRNQCRADAGIQTHLVVDRAPALLKLIGMGLLGLSRYWPLRRSWSSIASSVRLALVSIRKATRVA